MLFLKHPRILKIIVCIFFFKFAGKIRGENSRGKLAGKTRGEKFAGIIRGENLRGKFAWKIQLFLGGRYNRGLGSRTSEKKNIFDGLCTGTTVSKEV